MNPALPSAAGDLRVRFVAKAAAEVAPELRYVLGTVLIPEETDYQGDIYSEDVVREAAWDFLRNYRTATYDTAGLQHEEEAGPRVELVESYVAPIGFDLPGPDGSTHTIKKGSWLIGYHIVDDAVWADVQAGKYTGLSIEGIKWIEELPAAAGGVP